VVARQVAELVPDDEADLVGREPAVQERAPEHDALGGPDPDGERVGGRRPRRDVIDPHGRRAGVLAPLERPDRRSQLR
jgi:hypothetical protein